ncbi:MAG: hypothetical protein GC152_09540 [Alphaproteobacteria bacterium]|nr:hypothetical protein [Alphaproteobacteria bacterium]
MGAFANHFQKRQARACAVALGAFALFTAVGAAAIARGANDHDRAIEIDLEERRNGALRVVYDLPRPVSRLDLGPDLGGYRTRAWRVIGGEAELIVEDGRDVLRAAAPLTRFRTATLEVAPLRIERPRTYEAISPLGPDGALIYTGHFQPVSADGARHRTSISVTPGNRRHVVAFSEVVPHLSGWRSRFDNPAFIYVGAPPTIQREDLVAVIDPSIPDWAANEISAAASAMLDYLGGRFGWALDATPNLFVAYEPNGEPGRAMFSGDALPAQIRVGLAGGAWDRPSYFATNVLRTGVAHETAHIWQTAARPADAHAPDWIHEGGANAIAAKAMVEIGWWDDGAAARDLATARSSCIELIAGTSLPRIEAAGGVDASYACGQTINELAARAHPDGAIGFWNEFIQRARASGGYGLDMFFAVAADHGGERFALELRRLATLPQGRPAETIARIEAAATGPATGLGAGPVAASGPIIVDGAAIANVGDD